MHMTWISESKKIIWEVQSFIGFGNFLWHPIALIARLQQAWLKMTAWHWMTTASHGKYFWYRWMYRYESNFHNFCYACNEMLYTLKQGPTFFLNYFRHLGSILIGFWWFLRHSKALFTFFTMNNQNILIFTLKFSIFVGFWWFWRLRGRQNHPNPTKIANLASKSRK